MSIFSPELSIFHFPAETTLAKENEGGGKTNKNVCQLLWVLAGDQTDQKDHSVFLFHCEKTFKESGFCSHLNITRQFTQHYVKVERSHYNFKG